MQNGADRYAVGVDFGGTSVKLGLVDGEGRILARDRISTREVPSPEAWVEAVDGRLDALAAAQGLTRDRLAGIGVGVPGFIDFERGFIHTLPNVPGWTNVHFVRMAEERFRMRVHADNDVNVMALGECTFGAGKLYQHALFVTLGTGVGGAILIDNRLYRGAHSLAGEIGHMSIELDGIETAKGIGCLEEYVGNRALVDRAARALAGGTASSLRARIGEDPARLTVKMLAEEAGAGDAVSCEVFDFFARCLAAVFSSVTFLLQPQAILIGGGVAHSGPVLFEPLRRHMERRLVPTFLKDLDIRTAQLGADAGTIGAACLALST